MPYKDKEKRKINHRLWMREYYARHKRNGLCLRCNQPQAELHVYCLLHISQHNKRIRNLTPEARIKKNLYKKNMKHKRILENRCVDCNMPLNEESRMGVRCINCNIRKYKTGY